MTTVTIIFCDPPHLVVKTHLCSIVVESKWVQETFKRWLRFSKSQWTTLKLDLVSWIDLLVVFLFAISNCS